jgi:hypothetical protein
VTGLDAEPVVVQNSKFKIQIHNAGSNGVNANIFAPPRHLTQRLLFAFCISDFAS